MNEFMDAGLPAAEIPNTVFPDVAPPVIPDMSGVPLATTSNDLGVTVQPVGEALESARIAELEAQERELLGQASEAAWNAPQSLEARVGGLEQNAVSVQAYNGLVNAFNALSNLVAEHIDLLSDHAEHIDSLEPRVAQLESGVPTAPAAPIRVEAAVPLGPSAAS